MQRTALIAVMCLAAAAAGQSFQLLGLPAGQGGSMAFGISADGSVVTGASGVNGDYGPGWSWTASGGRVDLAGGSFLPNTGAYGISGDGRYLVGETGASRYGSPATAYRYDRTNGAMELLPTPAPFNRTRPLAASGDGGVVAGFSDFGDTGVYVGQAFRWTPATGTQLLGYSRGGHNRSAVTAVSRDGGTLVGYSSGFGSQGFVWTDASGMRELPTLPGVNTSTQALGMNWDASIFVGYSGSTETAAIWRNGQISSLGIPTGYIRSRATGVSDDGNVVVGVISTGPLYTAAIWHEAAGWQPLDDYLFGLGVTVPDNINMFYPTGISADGRTICGYTSVPGSIFQGFVVTIPAPSVCIVLLSGIALSHRRRRDGV